MPLIPLLLPVISMLVLLIAFSSNLIDAYPHVREETITSSSSSRPKISSHAKKVAMMMSSGGENDNKHSLLGGLEKSITVAPLQIPDEKGRIYNPAPSNLQAAGVPGGYNPQDVKEEGVQKAAKFACEETFKADFYPYNSTAENDPDGKGKRTHRFQVVEASTQVVAGVNYKLLVDVYKPDDEFGLVHCSVESFVVYDRFGDMSVTSHTSEYLLSCTDINMKQKFKKEEAAHAKKMKD